MYPGVARERKRIVNISFLQTHRHAVQLRGEFSDLQLARGDLLLHPLVFGLASVELVLHAGNLGLVQFLQLGLERRRLFVVVTPQVLKGLLKTIVVLGRQRLVCSEGRIVEVDLID